jgi:hypothetical protein
MIHLMLLLSVQQPDSADLHNAFREAVVAVYREAFKGPRSASNLRVDLESFKKIANLSESVDLSDIVGAIGKPATSDMNATCGSAHCPSIRARFVRVSNDTLQLYFDVGRVFTLQTGQPGYEVAGFVATFVRKSGRFRLEQVRQDSIT